MKELLVILLEKKEDKDFLELNAIKMNMTLSDFCAEQLKKVIEDGSPRKD